MSCHKCNKSKCGCQDVPLSTIPQFQCPPDVDCPVPSPCGEYYNAACVYYAGAGLPGFNIQEGDSLQSIIQRLVLFVTG